MNKNKMMWKIKIKPPEQSAQQIAREEEIPDSPSLSQFFLNIFLQLDDMVFSPWRIEVTRLLPFDEKGEIEQAVGYSLLPRCATLVGEDFLFIQAEVVDAWESTGGTFAYRRMKDGPEGREIVYLEERPVRYLWLRVGFS